MVEESIDVDGESESHEMPTPAPLTTMINWPGVTGARLEELLFGFLDEMGARNLIWRAGSASGVTAPDGGRDLEALFSSTTPDGAVELSNWWVEAKGRRSTVERRDVVDAVTAVAARSDVDVFVFCTNSRFSNPTRDWVDTWQSSHPRPKVKLWDCDDLSRFTRRYPLVAARVVPELLDDSDRLALLVERFEEFGESPTLRDAEYFWQRSDHITSLPLVQQISAIVMFSYAETDHGLVDRPWVSLIPETEVAGLHIAIYATTLLASLVMVEKARPLDDSRVLSVGAYLILAAMASVEPERLLEVLENPHSFVEGSEDIAGDPRAVETFREAIVLPMWARVQNELLEVCSDDCRRLSIDRGIAFAPPLVGERYWRRFGVGDPPDRGFLQMEFHEQPCVVGLPLSREKTCPLALDPSLSLQRLTELTQILRYRRSNPGDHA